ncbi:hypothetical protein Pgy4_35323 [Pseudomonas savastanoi pv. glycinea str. race 4]|uniref:Uncharacterized protein n=1 Tax=Pseudomonas savastanoi pv. glycinea str. race 4 TaxID=875330 RepID=F3CD75_PSESG|nr:hypothetical protein Pgy4_29990 [Pseudomonas savastanoi pv. glycinea str. race 4]EGH18236.1 hypothetical protein Pgy4_35323 [Pseudomonas savastanoi pv. glycinea str. race 4]
MQVRIVGITVYGRQILMAFKPNSSERKFTSIKSLIIGWALSF